VKNLRVLCPTGSEKFKLPGFSDASERAYSAPTYLRRFGCDKTITVQIMCQTKVAALKSQSIPKLELCDTLLLSKLAPELVTCTNLECPIYLCTNCELVLKWIAGSSRCWKTFVANRVSAIQEFVSNKSLRIIPGDSTPLTALLVACLVTN
jgi:hypothetical protein